MQVLGHCSLLSEPCLGQKRKPFPSTALQGHVTTKVVTMVYEVLPCTSQNCFTNTHQKKYFEHLQTWSGLTRAFKLSLEFGVSPSQVTGTPAAQAEQLPASKQVEFKVPAPEQGSLFLPPLFMLQGDNTD